MVYIYLLYFFLRTIAYPSKNHRVPLKILATSMTLPNNSDTLFKSWTVSRCCILSARLCMMFGKQASVRHLHFVLCRQFQRVQDFKK